MTSKGADSNSKEIIGVVGIIVAIGLIIANINLIYGLLSTVFTFGNTVIVKSPNIDVYWEIECVNEVSSINWGFLEPGDSKNVTIYVNNTGNVALTLNLSTEKWVPENADTYIALVWDYSGEEVQPGEVVPVTLTLTISENIEGITDFSFNILIIGKEVEE